VTNSKETTMPKHIYALTSHVPCQDCGGPVCVEFQCDGRTYSTAVFTQHRLGCEEVARLDAGHPVLTRAQHEALEMHGRYRRAAGGAK
jgi:hypothetical protein